MQVRLSAEFRGERIDRAICRQLSGTGTQISVRAVRMALKDARILVNGRPVLPGTRVEGGEVLSLLSPLTPSLTELARQELPAPDVLFEDDELLVLNKSSGLFTQPIRAGDEVSLLHVAIAHAPQVATAGSWPDGGLVHRLDCGTSGVVLFAKSKAQREYLRACFGAHTVEKEYWAWTQRQPSSMRVDRPILSRGGRSVHVLAPHEVAKTHRGPPLWAATEFKVRTHYSTGVCWVEAHTTTGRRHQVRAHLAYAGAPILGDPIYRDPNMHGPAHIEDTSDAWVQHSNAAPRRPPDSAVVTRLALHAARMTLPDGRCFVAPLPADLAALHRTLAATSI